MQRSARASRSSLPTHSLARAAGIPVLAFCGAIGVFSGCSSQNWTPPPAGQGERSDAANQTLVKDLAALMETEGLWNLELDDQRAGIRVALDRRQGGTPAPIYMTSTGNMASTGTGPVAAGPGAAPGGGAASSAGSDATLTAKAAPAEPEAALVPEVAPDAAKDVDAFHPDNLAGADGQRPPEPAPVWGGRVIVHLSNMPKHINYVTENSGVTRRMLYELTETLLLQDWETHLLVPSVASSYVQEDMLVLKSDAAERYPMAKNLRVRPHGMGTPYEGQVLYGTLEERGDAYLVSPMSQGGSALEAPLEVPKEDVESVERGCALTFQINSGVRWQPAVGEAKGKPYRIEDQTVNAEDLYFSWSVYANPEVDCDEKRFQFEKIADCEVLGPLTVRFLAQEQYFSTLDSVGRSMVILPRHVYDLSDPDCPWYDPEADASDQAQHINENPHNQLWVGCGPYQVTEFNQQYVEAKRFKGYFNPENSGYFDTLRWRYIDNDNLAFQALLNEELDYFERVKSADYFGPATSGAEFSKGFYKGYKYLGQYGYTGWNTQRPYLSDKRVRQAFAYAFPFDECLRTVYKNLARQITGPFPYDSDAYDHSVKPLPYDPAQAQKLLTEAGFIDTDGNGLVDKDGRDLKIEFMMPSGNDASRTLGLKLKDEYARIGVDLSLVPLEWATFIDRMRKREFDACNLAWIPDLESDPEQVWHSKWGKPEAEGSNNSGIQDPELDRLIEAGQREIDYEKRQEIWHQMHRYIYELQPYLFGYNVPVKFAASKRLRGIQNFAPDPGYSIRRWHYVSLDVPGTRPAR